MTTVTIEDIKSKAKQIRKRKPGMKQAAALDKAAQSLGFQTYKSAVGHIQASEKNPPAKRPGTPDPVGVYPYGIFDESRPVSFDLDEAASKLAPAVADYLLEGVKEGYIGYMDDQISRVIPTASKETVQKWLAIAYAPAYLIPYSADCSGAAWFFWEILKHDGEDIETIEIPEEGWDIENEQNIYKEKRVEGLKGILSCLPSNTDNITLNTALMTLAVGIAGGKDRLPNFCDMDYYLSECDSFLYLQNEMEKLGLGEIRAFEQGALFERTLEHLWGLRGDAFDYVPAYGEVHNALCKAGYFHLESDDAKAAEEEAFMDSLDSEYFERADRDQWHRVNENSDVDLPIGIAYRKVTVTQLPKVSVSEDPEFVSIYEYSSEDDQYWLRTVAFQKGDHSKGSEGILEHAPLTDMSTHPEKVIGFVCWYAGHIFEDDEVALKHTGYALQAILHDRPVSDAIDYGSEFAKTFMSDKAHNLLVKCWEWVESIKASKPDEFAGLVRNSFPYIDHYMDNEWED